MIAVTQPIVAIQQVDLLLWDGSGNNNPNWLSGPIGRLPESIQAAGRYLIEWANQSSADYLLLWQASDALPEQDTLASLIRAGVDIAHIGLKQGAGDLAPDLDMVALGWNMINAPQQRPSVSWRLSLDYCLIRREALLSLQGLDPAFVSKSAAGLDLGYRALKLGAVIEHRPELLAGAPALKVAKVDAQDFYTFVIRHFDSRWAFYILIRRCLKLAPGVTERRSFQNARQRCRNTAAFSYDGQALNLIEPGAAKKDAIVSALIPTLGRYPYLPQALDSLRRQTIKPYEVIVVDQNPVEARQPELYEPFKDLNLVVIWQEQQGQSIARNAGLSAAQGEYILMFEDDATAPDDLIEAHLRLVTGGRFHISAGIAYPPPPTDYKLPPDLTHYQLAKTFATGNSLMRLDIAKRIGGFDRSYDRGPGADLDFGTRLYLAGYRIVHNPAAWIIHFKAPMGGLRTHGAHKYNTDAGLLEPFPPVTQSYYGLRYLNSRQRRERVLLLFVASKIPRHLRRGGAAPARIGAWLKFAGSLVALPLKWRRSLKQARAMLAAGTRLNTFADNAGKK